MAIVKQLIEKMGGTIDVTSKLDKGSRFAIEIPFDIASEEDIRKNETENNENDIS